MNGPGSAARSSDAVRHIGFIRNVMTGRNGLTAQRLIDIITSSGGSGPASYRGTGNIAFDAPLDDLDPIIERIEVGIAAVIGRREPVFVRSLDDLARAASTDPFAHPPIDDVHERCVTYLQSTASELAPLPVTSSRGDLIVFEVDGLDVYSVTRLVDGRTTSPAPLLQRVSNALATSRNWSTIEFILDKEAPDQEAIDREATDREAIDSNTGRTPQWT